MLPATKLFPNKHTWEVGSSQGRGASGGLGSAYWHTPFGDMAQTKMCSSDFQPCAMLWTGLVMSENRNTTCTDVSPDADMDCSELVWAPDMFEGS